MITIAMVQPLAAMIKHTAVMAANTTSGVEKAIQTASDIVTESTLPVWLQKLIDGVMACGFTLLRAVITGVIGWYIIKFVVRWVKTLLTKSSLDDSISGFLISVLRSSLKVILLITIIGILGIPMSSIVAVIGSAGLAIGLALQGCLTNFAGGVLILIMKPFRVGDYIIDSSGNEGTVTAIDIIYTKLVTPDNRAVTIPNGTLANNTVTNATREAFRRLDFNVSIGYEEDIDRVKKVLYDVAVSCEFVEKERECMVFVNSFDPSAVSMVLRFWVASDKYWPVKWEIQEKIKKSFDKHQISIPFDQLDVHMVEK